MDIDATVKVAAFEQAVRGFELGVDDAILGVYQTWPKPTPKSAQSYALIAGYEVGHEFAKERLDFDGLYQQLKAAAAAERGWDKPGRLPKRTGPQPLAKPVPDTVAGEAVEVDHQGKFPVLQEAVRKEPGN